MRLRTVSGSSWTLTPVIRACPASGARRVARIRTRAVFPAPLGPSRPSTLPAGTLRSTPARALVLPNALLTPSTSIMAAPLWEMAVAVISTLSENEGSAWRLTLRPSAVGAEARSGEGSQRTRRAGATARRDSPDPTGGALDARHVLPHRDGVG